MRAEHIKAWLRGALEEEDPKGQGEEGNGDKFSLLTQLVQAVWNHGFIPHQLLWIIVVLIKKSGGDYHGIGYLNQFGRCLNRLWTIGST
jgi:hypothetical protein